jgi:formamidopyrimidine-DNA glycosylase
MGYSNGYYALLFIMPEGPEVRRMAEGLARRIENKDVIRAEVLGGKWLKKPLPGLSWIQQLLPLKVQRVKVKGKLIYVELTNGVWMWNTLGMGGGWRDQRAKHSHFVLEMGDGTEVFFEDVRRFGNICFTTEDVIQDKLKALGPDMLNEEVSPAVFLTSICKGNRTNWNICKALMDQSVVCGVGNYIKSEALYRAGVNPWLKVGEIPEVKLTALHGWICKIIRRSYEQGGATLMTYTDMDLNRGMFTFEFEVYMRSQDPLGHDVIREETPDKRTTHWVPEIQK